MHPVGIVFATPAGAVSSYLLGVGYQPGDVRLGVTRAQWGSIAAAALPVLLLCFHFDPTTGRYTLAIMKVLRLAGAITAVTVAGTLFLAFRRDRGRRMKLWLPEAATSAPEMDYLLIALLLISCAVLALVFGLMLLYVFKYRAGSSIDRGAVAEKTWRLETGWTVATLLIFFGLFVWGAISTSVCSSRPPMR